MSKKKCIRKKVSIFAALFVLILIVTGCNSNMATNNEETDVNSDESVVCYVGPKLWSGTLDPVKGAYVNGYDFIFNALTRVNKEGNYEGDLATDWEISNDGLEYIFNLREGVKFHDGTDFNADDVVFTFQTVKENQAMNKKVVMTNVEKIEKTGEFQVKFTLSKPYSPFLDMMYQMGIVPSDSYNAESFDTVLTGTGPYKFVQRDAEQQLIVDSNSDYWEGAPDIERVTFVNMDSKTAFANAKSGQVDLVMTEPSYMTETVEGMHTQTLKTIDCRAINLPCVPRQEYVDKNGEKSIVGNDVTCDIAVRKALNIGIDRQQIIDYAYNGIGNPAKGYPEILPWSQRMDYEDGQLDEACKLLENAGWVDTDGDGIREKNGLKCSFEVYTFEMDRYETAVAVAQCAKEMGIEIKVIESTIGEIFDGPLNNQGGVWIVGIQYNPNILVGTFKSDMTIKGGYNNTCCIWNEDVDKLIDDALAQTEKEKANEKWKEVLSKVDKQYPYLYLFDNEHCYFVNDNLDISLDTQIIHPAGHGLPVICNIKDWTLR